MNRSVEQFETLLGLVGKDFVMMMADTSMQQHGYVPTDDYDKFLMLTPFLVAGFIGDPGPAKSFYKCVAANQSYHRIHFGYDLPPESIAHNTRIKVTEGAHHLVLDVFSLLAGYDQETGPELHFIDHFGSHMKLDTACHGIGGHIGRAVLDSVITTELTEEQGLDMMTKAAAQIKRCSPGPEKKFRVVVVDKNGIHYLPNIV